MDQTDFLLGKSEKSNREGFPVFVADRLEAVKWRNWKVVFYDKERDWWTPPLKLGVPKAFDLIIDPKEEYPQTGLRNSWNAGPAIRIVAKFEQSLKKYPPIEPGTPDPYSPLRENNDAHTAPWDKRTVLFLRNTSPRPKAPRRGSAVRAEALSRSLIMGKNSMKSILHSSVKKAHVIGMCVLAFGFLATPVLTPSLGNAQDARVAKSMAALRDQTTKLGAPKIDGRDAVGGRDAPALYFGSTKMNNNFSVVDAVAEEGGRGTAATLFVKGGDDYIRVATNVSTRKGNGRGLGTVLTGAPLEAIRAGNAYYGKASVLGTPYISGYEPIKDATGATIGVYFVGYTK